MPRHATKKTHGSRYGWRWALVLCAGLAWLSIGCSPQTLTYFILPFTDNNKEPECTKLFKSNKEVHLVILSNFVEKQFRPEYIPADQELAESVAASFQLRCMANKHTLKVTPQTEVRNYYLQQLSEDGDISPAAIGRKFKANYVLELSIEEFGLYQKDFTPKSFRGSARINMKLHNVSSKEQEGIEYQKYYNSDYAPSRGIPMEVGNRNPAEFRQAFMRKMGQEISRRFIAYNADELKEWE